MRVAVLASLSLLLGGCIMPGPQADGLVITIPPFVVPAELTYAVPDHVIVITFEPVGPFEGTFGTVQDGLRARIHHTRGDWNNDLEKNEFYNLDQGGLEALNYVGGVTWEMPGDFGTRYLARCDAESYAHRVGGSDMFDANLFPAIALAGKTWKDGQAVPLELLNTHLGMELKVETDQKGNRSELSLVHGLIDGDRKRYSLAYVSDHPYPVQLGNFELQSWKPASGPERVLTLRLDACGPERAPPRVGPDEFLAAAAAAGRVGAAIAAGVEHIQNLPQWAAYADAAPHAAPVTLLAAPNDAFGEPGWQVQIHWLDRQGNAFVGNAVLREVMDGLVPTTVEGSTSKMAVSPRIVWPAPMVRLDALLERTLVQPTDRPSLELSWLPREQAPPATITIRTDGDPFGVAYQADLRDGGWRLVQGTGR